MADRERIISHDALREDLLIHSISLFRFRKIAGEITADQALAGNTGYLLGGPIYIGDQTVRTDDETGAESVGFHLSLGDVAKEPFELITEKVTER